MDKETRTAIEKFNAFDWKGLTEEQKRIIHGLAYALENSLPRDGKWHELRIFVRQTESDFETCDASLILQEGKG